MRLMIMVLRCDAEPFILGWTRCPAGLIMGQKVDIHVDTQKGFPSFYMYVLIGFTTYLIVYSPGF